MPGRVPQSPAATGFPLFPKEPFPLLPNTQHSALKLIWQIWSLPEEKGTANFGQLGWGELLWGLSSSKLADSSSLALISQGATGPFPFPSPSPFDFPFPSPFPSPFDFPFHSPFHSPFPSPSPFFPFSLPLFFFCSSCPLLSHPSPRPSLFFFPFLPPFLSAGRIFSTS